MTLSKDSASSRHESSLGEKDLEAREGERRSNNMWLGFCFVFNEEFNLLPILIHSLEQIMEPVEWLLSLLEHELHGHSCLCGQVRRR